MKTIKDFNFRNKRVLVRCDFNVPLDERGNLLDDFRIKQTIPTIEYLVKAGAKIILMSHLGRPEGKVVESLRSAPVQKKLTEYLKIDVANVRDCVGREVEDRVRQMQAGEILLLENLRFNKGEEENDENFAQELSQLGDIYINDAFGVCHRNHASIVGIPKYLPAGAGFLLEKEIKVFSDLMEKPEKPLMAIIGGTKVETKTKPIDKISEIAEFVLIGGLIKKEIKDKNIQFKYSQKIIGPVEDIDKGDISLQTIDLFKNKIKMARTIFWNGPLGKIEEERYQKGTKEIAEAIIESDAFSVAGGGETAEFINKIGLISKFNHVSTGGGAMLAFLSGEKLPGLEALNYYGN